MSDAPERIWAARGLYTAHLDNRWPTPVEYVRADRIEALTAKLDSLQDRLDAANKARAHVMKMAVKKQAKLFKAVDALREAV
jgi:hypothetical protein